jgi:hypothetical protein
MCCNRFLPVSDFVNAPSGAVRRILFVRVMNHGGRDTPDRTVMLKALLNTAYLRRGASLSTQELPEPQNPQIRVMLGSEERSHMQRQS